MLEILLLPTTWLLIATVLLSGLAGELRQLPDPILPSPTEPLVDAPQWNVWGADQYALADDGAFIWIGATGGVVRWDKANGTYRRYSMVDGLPQSRVLSIAVDSAGNRWFGGDGGLSRLDSADKWTHFTTANSGLHSNAVAAIALGANDALYVSHGLPDGAVSRLTADGVWRWFANRRTAIQADYASIVQRGNSSSALWTVAGAEVWIGSQVYDGVLWHERKLPTTPDEPLGLVTDSRNHVFALSSLDSAYGASSVYEWDGNGWIRHNVALQFSGHVSALSVGPDDKVWVGLQDRGNIPYNEERAAVQELSGANRHWLGVYPMSALLSTPEGLWALGPSWLMVPSFSVTVLADEPLYPGVLDAVVAQDGSLWMGTFGATQSLDDKGTLPLEDDAWQRLYPFGPEAITAFERTPSDIWYTSSWYGIRVGYFEVVRYHRGERIDYTAEFPLRGRETHDIFAQDERHIWFAAPGYGDTPGYVFGLDDGGTPADLGDDVWQTFPIQGSTGKVSVAVDAGGQLWHGQQNGLYRYDGSAWQRVYGDRAVCDLVPASDGTIYAQVALSVEAGCGAHSDEVLVVRSQPAAGPHLTLVELLASSETARVRTASRRNSLWTIAPDDAIWYVSRLDGEGRQLHRRDASGVNAYALPVQAESVQRLEVDPRGHLWVVSGVLWRTTGPLFIPLYLPLVISDR